MTEGSIARAAWRRISLVAAAAILVCACGAAADEYRMVPVTAWSSGFQRQSEVDKLLGVPGAAGSKGDVRNANCNAVLVQVRRRADVCYLSGMGEPYMSGLSPSDFNALQAIIDAAHDTTGGKQRIEVHCWIVTFATASSAGASPVYYEHNDPADPENYWVTLDDEGNETADKAFDPGHPKCEQYIVDVCMDLVTNFDIDGIHFDYIRFTGSDQGYNPTSVARYNARYDLNGQPDPADERFKQWRRDQVSAVVRKVYARVQEVKPGVKVSGSFVSGAPSPTDSTREAFKACVAYDDCYSDWDSWIQEGIVDLACPMTYFDDDARHNDYLNWINFDKDRKAGRHMVIDAGCYLNYLQDAIDQLVLTRAASPSGHYADGFGCYSYQSPYRTVKGDPPTYGPWSTFSTQLVAQVTPSPANIPVMPWKSSPTKGMISGTVTLAPAGDWADCASVRITGPETRHMICDGTGFYAFVDLTPGQYTIRANCASYEEQRTVNVAAGGVTNGNFELSTTDASPPVVSDVQIVSVSDGAAEITWLTDDPATSQVEFDMVPYYGQSSEEYHALLTDHSMTLYALNASTSYHFRVKSTNGAGLTGYSGDYQFTTLAPIMTITIDELDKEWTSSGSWATGSSSGGWNGGYKYASCTNGSPTASCAWTPTLSRSGPYDVSIYYRDGSNRATDARFTINHAGGSIPLSINQTTNGQKWNKVATGVQFDFGRSGNVALTNKTANVLPKVVVADAVRFEYKGDPTPPSMSAVSDDRYCTSTTCLHASWAGSDPQSGIQCFKYAVGTLPGMADVKAWTDAGTATSAEIGGLSLVVGQTYYVSARAVNGSGLTSTPMTSGGVTVAHAVAGVGEAKALTDGEPVALPASVVTARFAGRFYVQEPDRTSGIRVESDAAVSPGQSVQVFGVLRLVDGCERAITDCKVVPVGF